MNYYSPKLRDYLLKYHLILKQFHISEPTNSLRFITMKSLGFGLKHYNFFFKYYSKSNKANKLFKDPRTRDKFKYYFYKRLNDYPLQYILQEWLFKDFIVECKEPVLIPRIETEQIVDLAQKNFEEYKLKNRKNQVLNNNKKFKFLEIGIGTGVIFISLLRKYSNLECIGLDINPTCIQLSKRNAKKLLNQNFDYQLIQMDFNNYSCVEEEKFDFIVSNPPYIKLQDENVMRDVIKYESHQALFSGTEGLDLISTIIKKSRQLVKKGGFVILEIDPGQKDKLFSLLISEKFSYFLFEEDMFGRTRFLIYYIN
jgi:release factor glutamine methyltransferase